MGMDDRTPRPGGCGIPPIVDGVLLATAAEHVDADVPDQARERDEPSVFARGHDEQSCRVAVLSPTPRLMRHVAPKSFASERASENTNAHTRALASALERACTHT